MTVDNRHASIGTQINAERLIFGGDMPGESERERLRGEVGRCFADAVYRGGLCLKDDATIAAGLWRLFAGRSEWLEDSLQLMSLEVDPTECADLYLPLEECMRWRGSESPALIRCG